MRAQEQVWWGGAPYRARWTMPPALSPITRQPLPPATTANRSFYAIDVGKVLHFAMYDTESVLDVSDVSSANVAWLKGDLGVAILGGAKWVIAGGHRPLCACVKRPLPFSCAPSLCLTPHPSYTTHTLHATLPTDCTNGGYKSSNKDCKGMAEILRTQVEAVFAPVDMVLGAHMHGYERTLPILNGTAVTSNATAAPVYIVNGAGGNREGNDDPKGDAPWSAPGAHSGSFGYGLMTIVSAPGAGKSTLEYQFVESATGKVLDSVTLSK